MSKTKSNSIENLLFALVIGLAFCFDRRQEPEEEINFGWIAVWVVAIAIIGYWKHYA